LDKDIDFIYKNIQLVFKDILKINNEIIEQVRNWRNSKNVKKYLINDNYISKQEHKKWIERLKIDNKNKVWIIIYKDKYIGIVNLTDINHDNKSTQWGYYLANIKDRGKGLGEIILLKLINIVFDEMGFEKMITKVLSNNIIALHIYKKFGFIITSTDKQIIRDEKKIDILKIELDKKNWMKIKKDITKKIFDKYFASLSL
jgi:UDP-4-amino-4,6-dideoxy-N-acetyl-beta-L-altrosamine N-acetyltransferase